MGDIVRQDRAYTIGLVNKILSIFEVEYHDKGDSMLLKLISICMFFLVSCLGGIRGYDAV